MALIPVAILEPATMVCELGATVSLAFVGSLDGKMSVIACASTLSDATNLPSEWYACPRPTQHSTSSLSLRSTIRNACSASSNVLVIDDDDDPVRDLRSLPSLSCKKPRRRQAQTTRAPTTHAI